MSIASRALVSVAGLMGAAGVGLWARGSHGDLPVLATAGPFLLVHAAAVLAIGRGARPGRGLVAGAILLAAGASAFAAALALPALAGLPMPMLAPVGGSTAILGWLVVAGFGLVSRS